MKKVFNIFLIKLLRIYTLYSPFEKAKSKFSNIQKNIISKLYNDFEIVSKIGTKFRLKLPEDKNRLTIFTTGYCEKSITKILIKIIKNDDVLFDIGANIGWYSLIFAKCGSICHSFEPNSDVFNRLKQNCLLNSLNTKCRLNNFALGNKIGIASFYTFNELHHGYSSLSALGRNDAKKHEIPINTMDRYIEENMVSKIDLIKLDVEGGELNILKGSIEMFKKGILPIFLLELNKKTCLAFGYEPIEITNLLKKYNYDFYSLKKRYFKHELKKLSSLDILKIERENVIAYIEAEHKDRIRFY